MDQKHGKSDIFYTKTIASAISSPLLSLNQFRCESILDLRHLILHAENPFFYNNHYTGLSFLFKH
jgi:meiotically up-regulated gene 157 (Mug157) protein